MDRESRVAPALSILGCRGGGQPSTACQHRPIPLLILILEEFSSYKLPYTGRVRVLMVEHTSLSSCRVNEICPFRWLGRMGSGVQLAPPRANLAGV